VLSRITAGEVGHCREIGGEALVHPARHLLRAKWLVAARGHPRREPRRVEIQQVGEGCADQRLARGGHGIGFTRQRE
jgi:hypothetical protein